KLWSVLDSAQPGDDRLLRSAGALALYDPENPRWTEAGGKVAQALVIVDPISLGSWVDILRDVRSRLTVPLATIFRDRTRPETEHAQSTNILALWVGDQPELLAEVLMDADTEGFQILFPLAQRQAARTLPIFRAEIARESPSQGVAGEPVEHNKPSRHGW